MDLLDGDIMMVDYFISFSFLLIVFWGFKKEFNSYYSALISTILTLILPGLIFNVIDRLFFLNNVVRLGVLVSLVSIGAYTSIQLFSPKQHQKN